MLGSKDTPEQALSANCQRQVPVEPAHEQLSTNSTGSGKGT